MMRKAVEHQEESADDKSLVVVKDERQLLFDQLLEQYKMSLDEQRQLIRSISPLTDKYVRIAVASAKSFGLPLQGINMIPVGNSLQVYINSDGLRWRIHTDSRGVKKSIASVTHQPSKDEPWVEVTATIVMGDGSEYVNLGVVACTPGPDVANSIMKATTKAKRRASIDAVGVALPIAEDYLEWVDEQRSKNTIEGSFTISPPAPAPTTEPKNLAELLAWITVNNHTVDEASALVGDLSKMSQDIIATYNKLKETWKI